MKKNYVIVPGNTDLNRGDQALIWESIKIFKEIDVNSKFNLLECGLNEREMHMQSWQTKKKGYNFISPVLLHPGRNSANLDKKSCSYTKFQLFKWGSRAGKDLIISLLLLSKSSMCNKMGVKFLNKKQIEALKTIKKSNGVIVKGGGFLHSYGKITDSYYVYYSLYHIFLAKKFNVPVYILPNSFGPFKGALVKKMVRSAFEYSSLLTTREKKSELSVKNELGISTKTYPDLGFFIDKGNNNQVEQDIIDNNIPIGSKKCIAITLRPYRFPKSQNPKVAYENYIKSIVEFIEWANINRYSTTLVAQTLGPSKHEDDRSAIDDVINRIKCDITVIDNKNFDCEDLKCLYSKFDYVIGTRFHSVIFSLSSGVPSIAIGYGGNKGEGIMDEIGLSEFQIPIEKIDCNELKKIFNCLVENEKNIKKRINEYLAYANVKRNELIEEIRGNDVLSINKLNISK